nr:hypothetical protein [Candidatus Freyarchaeota archaeon]
MGVDKKVEETLKVLNLKVIEQGMDKIAGVFDQYTAQMSKELATINQRISDIECRLDNLEKFSSSMGVSSAAALQILPEAGASSVIESSLTPPPKPRQPVKRHLEPVTFAKENVKAEKLPREGFGGYRPTRGSIEEEKHVKVSVFSKELDRRKEAASAAAGGERTVVISHTVREDTTPNEPIDVFRLTPRDIESKNKEEIEQWLCKTEECFNGLEPKTQEEIMINYTQLKAFLCKEKREKVPSCTRCLVQNTIVCPLYKF